MNPENKFPHRFYVIEHEGGSVTFMQAPAFLKKVEGDNRVWFISEAEHEHILRQREAEIWDQAANGIIGLIEVFDRNSRKAKEAREK
jgi:hypothetical protein